MCDLEDGREVVDAWSTSVSKGFVCWSIATSCNLMIFRYNRIPQEPFSAQLTIGIHLNRKVNCRLSLSQTWNLNCMIYRGWILDLHARNCKLRDSKQRWYDIRLWTLHDMIHCSLQVCLCILFQNQTEMKATSIAVLMGQCFNQWWPYSPLKTTCTKVHLYSDRDLWILRQRIPPTLTHTPILDNAQKHSSARAWYLNLGFEPC